MAGGSKAEVQDLIVRLSREGGVDPALALAVAEQESGFDPRAVGDQGCSYGLYQANRCGGAGTGIDVATLEDPAFNTRQFLGRIRDTIAAGFAGSPGELAAEAQRPYDREGYARKVNALYARYAATLTPPAPSSPAPAVPSTTPAISLGRVELPSAGGVLAGAAKTAGGALLEHFGAQLLVVLVVIFALVLIASAIL